jgi:hypothetical protein
MMPTPGETAGTCAYYCREKQNVSADSIIYTSPGDDYVGVCDFVPLDIDGRKAVSKAECPSKQAEVL